MKKILSFAIAISLVLTSLLFTGCAGGGNNFELALVTDLGTVDDKGFNQGAWEGIQKFAKENGKTYKYYKPQEVSTNSFLQTFELAIKAGAKVIVCPGFLFQEPVFIAQEQYPDVKFIILDSTPMKDDQVKIADNTIAVEYAEAESGYLAGYAAVKDGNTKLGFAGGVSVPNVIRFGSGFAQGAEAAANELGVNVDLKYNYTGTFEATPEVKSLAASWYNSGVECIFACGGAIGNSIMAAADEKNKSAGQLVAKVIGVDRDQSGESESVITSALKMVGNSVYDSLVHFYKSNEKGGESRLYSAKNDGVGLVIDNAKFNKFSKADFENVLAKIKNGQVSLNEESSSPNPRQMVPFSRVNIEYIN